MNILAIDTTTKKAQVAVYIQGNIIYKNIDNEITHSEKLLPLINETLNEAGITLKGIDLFALTVGPGSFTGVRIGIATIKAMAKVMDKPIFDTTSLKLFAVDAIYKITQDIDYVVSLMDAKNSRVYYSVFKCIKKNNNTTLEDVSVFGNLVIDRALTTIKNANILKGNILFTGDIAETYKDRISDTFNNNIITIQNSTLDISSIFKTIPEDLQDCNLKNSLNLDAKYYRNSEAERTRRGE